MKKTLTLALVSAFLVGLPAPALPDSYPPSEYCSKPKKNLMGDGWDLPFGKTLREAVNDYKSCLQQFAREQRAAAKVHEEAAAQAVEKWNSFLKCVERSNQNSFPFPDC